MSANDKPKCRYCCAAFGPIISGVCAYCWAKIYAN